MTTFQLQVRDGVRFDNDGFTVDSGSVTEVLGSVDAPYPMAATKPAEELLRSLGITWKSYVQGEWTCGWRSSRGIIALTPVAG